VRYIISKFLVLLLAISSAVITQISVNAASFQLTWSENRKRWKLFAHYNRWRQFGTCQTEVVDGATDPGPLTITGVAGTQTAFVRVVVQETNNTTNMTPTASYTLMTETVGDTGTANTSIRTDGEIRVTIPGGDETNDPSTSTDVDGVSLFVAFRETALTTTRRRVAPLFFP
jgi:hypothetical protein